MMRVGLIEPPANSIAKSAFAKVFADRRTMRKLMLSRINKSARNPVLAQQS